MLDMLTEKLSIAGARPQVNATDVQLSKLHVRSGEDSTVRLLRVTEAISSSPC